MELHEYQAKAILDKYGIVSPKYFVGETLHEIEHGVKKFGLASAVVKVQIHAGGRGKAGGIKLCKNVSEILHAASNLLGMKIVNNQTGPQGIIAKKVMVAELTDIAKEYYLACTVDRKHGRCVLIASREGGVEIEEIAKKDQEKILVTPIEKGKKVDATKVLQFLGLDEKHAAFIEQLVQAFFASDALLLEINPLVQMKDGRLTALDAKMSVDDNALFRQQEIAHMQEEDNSHEKDAKKHDLAYVQLDGSIGCIVNGAGLAMATCDLILLKGGNPANFLDVGGGASQEKVEIGFELVLRDSRVKAVLINIFGGIMNCEIIASALKEVHKRHKNLPPIALRMEGTHVEEAKEIIKKAHLQVRSFDSLDDAAKQVVHYGNTSQ